MRISASGQSAEETASNRLPDNPTGDIEFGIYGDEAAVFTPMYYPESFRIITDKKLEKTAAACEGQRVSIDELKNSKLHVTGRAHAADLDGLDEIAHTTKPVDVITPIIKEGGMEAVVKKVERGEVVGWDAFPAAQDWLVEYTIDLVSTGKDEYNNSGPESRYVE